MSPHLSWLVLVTVLGLGIAAIAPLHTLLLLDLGLDPVRSWFFGQDEQIEIATVFVDHTDIILLALLIGAGTRLDSTQRRKILTISGIWLWFLLALYTSVSYLIAPWGRVEIAGAGPAQVLYQLYRYCLKPTLFFPAAALLLSTEKRANQALAVLVAAGVFSALIAIPQGYSGWRAMGPYGSGNSLAGVLIVPFMATAARLLLPASIGLRVLLALSAGLMARALLFTQSRGAFSAILLALASIFLLASFRTESRTRLFRLAASTVLAAMCLILVKPDLLDRPTVKRFATTFSPQKQDTLEWRLTQPWAHYLSMVKERPWTGYGTDVDYSRVGATTPHNGYISLAMYSGIPVLLGYLAFATRSLRQMTRLVLYSKETTRVFLGLAILGGLVGILTHNIVESTLTNVDIVRKSFWLLTALALTIPRTLGSVPPSPAEP